MLRSFLILSITLVLAACSGGSSGSDGGTTTTTPGINSNLQSYVTAFETTFNAHINFSVDFDTDSTTGGTNDLGTTVGVCRVWSDGSREVLVNKTWWNSQDDISRKVLIFHELGHCYFNRNHDSTKDGAGAPKTMMYPVINPIVFWYKQELTYEGYPTYKDYYHAELGGTLSPMIAMSYFLSEETPEEAISPEEDLDENEGCVQYMDVPNPKNQTN